MKAKLLIRIASGFILFFAIGHTLGHVTRHNVKDIKAIEVQKMMIENKFDMFGSLRSYDQNYTGMSANLIFTLLMISIILWFLSSKSNDKQLALSILIPTSLCIFGFTITGFLYFFLLPALSCLIACCLLVIAIIQIHRRTNT